ncbi:MAG: hypothetical protein WA277_10295 [Nitrospirota bacterium]
MEIFKADITDIAAWWGAVIATLLLLWDVYKWKKAGPHLEVSASPNMQTFGGIPDTLGDKTYVVVEIRNTGNAKTTLTHLVGYHYSSFINKLRRKKSKNFFVPTPILAQPLPHILEAGERWIGGIEQNDKLEEMSRHGYLYCGGYHSCGKKPVVQRVVISKEILPPKSKA